MYGRIPYLNNSWSSWATYCFYLWRLSYYKLEYVPAQTSNCALTTITNDHISLSPEQSQHCVHVGSKEQESNDRVEKMEMIWSSGFELFRHHSCEKRKKNQLLQFKDHRMIVLPTTTSVLQSSLQQVLCFSTKKNFYNNFINSWNNRSRSGKVSYQWQHKIKQYISNFIIIHHAEESKKVYAKKTSRPRVSTPQILGFQPIQHFFPQTHPDYYHPHSHPTHYYHHWLS